MPRRLLVAPTLLACVLAAPIAGCGSSDEPAAAVDALPQRSADQVDPPAPKAAGLLGSVAAVPGSSRRIAYVDLGAAAKLGGQLTGDDLIATVLGDDGAGRARADDGADEAAQLGPTTVLVGASAARTVRGGAAAARAALASTTPPHAVIAPETEGAVQACLGDPVGEVIVGPDVLGRLAGAGAGITSSSDAPAGRKVRICVAPHLVRDLHAAERRLHAAFDRYEGAVVAQQEIGEREIVGAVVPADQLSRNQVTELLSGGPQLLELARG